LWKAEPSRGRLHHLVKSQLVKSHFTSLTPISSTDGNITCFEFSSYWHLCQLNVVWPISIWPNDAAFRDWRCSITFVWILHCSLVPSWKIPQHPHWPGANVVKHFSFVNNKWPQKDRSFVSGKHFRHSPIFASKAVYLSETHFKCFTLGYFHEKDCRGQTL
jgi:hypothetical protein